MNLLLTSILASASGIASAEPSSDWQDTLDRVVPSVLSIRMDRPRTFDTSGASNSQATGWVVDAEQGLVVTNRHVAGAGPSLYEGVWLNNEEVPLTLVYRDPVHDFALLRFEPESVRFMEVDSLELCAACAEVGLDVRVIGNDAGEKVSILPGTLARLDRNAPRYGSGRYNDFNTFYLQSASSTSGGSSGSPVVNVEGKVVALNAGASRRAASSFFLPLDRIERAVELARKGQPITRGTLQVTLLSRTWDEVRRLGLPADAERVLREQFPERGGLLVFDEVLPGGPAAGVLQPGDILLSANGDAVTGFAEFEAILDDAVGETVSLRVSRGGQTLEATATVGDLFAITPNSLLEFGRGILNPLSYQMARGRAIPVEGVVVTSPGYALGRAGVPVGAVIQQVGDAPTPDLDALEAALSSHPDGSRVPIRYRHVGNFERMQVAVVPIDRRWNPMRRCTEDRSTFQWSCRDAPPPKASEPRDPQTAAPRVSQGGPAQALASSLVTVDFDVPFRTEGIYGVTFRGTGLVVDAEEGLVAVDRDTVPAGLGDVQLTFGGSVQVPARVAWLHPVHNLAFVRYDPAALGNTEVRAATLDPRPLAAGDRVWQVSLDGRGRLLGKRTAVSRLQPVALPLPSPPFFRDRNLDLVELEGSTPSIGGAVTDKRGRVRALWASFVDLSGDKPRSRFSGLPSGEILRALEALRAGTAEPWPSLGVELAAVSLADARHLGLSDEDARRLEGLTVDRRTLVVSRLTKGSPAAKVLQEGDLIVEVSGEPVARFEAVETALFSGDAIPLTVVRGGVRMPVLLEPHVLSGAGTDRVLGFAGMLLHAPHAALAQQRSLDLEGVYIAWYWYGSPAGRFGLRPTRSILAVDGTPTPDLDSFLAAVEGRADRSALRLTTRALDGQIEVRTLKLDLTWWPTFEVTRDKAGEWSRVDH